MEDLIKRSDAIEAMEQRYQDILRIFKRKVKDGERAIALDMIGCIKSLPSADRPQGEWIYGEHDVAMCDGYRCNRCDFFVPWDYEHKFIDFINDYHYCPNCGARMKGADDGRNAD